MGERTEMLILNINGPMNSGKSTVSKILVNLLPNATFIEVDELMSDEEEAKLGLSMQDGWAERQKRLNKKLLHWRFFYRLLLYIQGCPLRPCGLRHYQKVKIRRYYFGKYPS